MKDELGGKVMTKKKKKKKKKKMHKKVCHTNNLNLKVINIVSKQFNLKMR